MDYGVHNFILVQFSFVEFSLIKRTVRELIDR